MPPRISKRSRRCRTRPDQLITGNSHQVRRTTIAQEGKRSAVAFEALPLGQPPASLSTGVVPAPTRATSASGTEQPIVSALTAGPAIESFSALPSAAASSVHDDEDTLKGPYPPHWNHSPPIRIEENDKSSAIDSGDESDESLFAEYIDNSVFSLFEEATEADDPAIVDSLENRIEDSQGDQCLVDPAVVRDNLDRSVQIVSSLKKTMPRATFLGAISIYGKARYTLENYNHLVAMMVDGGNPTVLPSASTMRKFVFPRLLKNNFVEASIETFPFKANYFKRGTKSTKQAKKEAEAVVVLPTAWAKMDVASLHVLREIACFETCRCRRRIGSTDLRVDSSAHVVCRGNNAKHNDTLWVNNNGVPMPSSPGMIIKIHMPTGIFVSAIRRKFTPFRCEEVKYRGEFCSALETEITSTLHVRFTSERGVYFEDGLSPIINDYTFQQNYKKCLQYLETLCERSHEFASERSNEASEQPESLPQTRRQRHRREHSSANRIGNSAPYLIPSDHLTIVRVGSGGSLGIFVSRFWVERIDDERNFFLFIYDDDEEQKTACTSVPTFGAPTFTRNGQHQDTESTSQAGCNTTGFLPNGMRYYMYRIILYADDFNPRSTLFPKGSVGGVYMSPSGLHVRSRRSQYSIRTVSLTPSGVSTNAVIDYIIDDLVSGSIEGFECVDAFGDTVRVFLDILGFIGDYPAASAVVDLNGHTSTAPCTQCGFVFNKSAGLPVYAYTTSVTSRNSSYRRTQQRTECIREAGLTKNERKILGMKALDLEEIEGSISCPLLKFASRYNTSLSSHSTGTPYSGSGSKLDAYSLNLIAPDHLISGLFKGLLTITFIQLKDDEARERLQIYLKMQLSEYGFQSQSYLFKSKKEKLVPGLSMSILYCILTVLPSSMRALNVFDEHPAKQMISNMHRLFSLLFWWPHVSHDGKTAWNFVHGIHMNTYHRALQVLAANFVKSVTSYNKSYPCLATHVDKPNTHRILELVQHTIPLFNHVAYVCEMVFESAHQPLKYFLSRNHSLGSHIYSVQLLLAKDWMVRIWCLWSIYNDERESAAQRQHALMGMVRLFVGRDMDTINWNLIASSSTFTDLCEHITTIMRGTVETRFKNWYQDSTLNFSFEPCWQLKSLPKGHTFPCRQKNFLDGSIRQLARLSLERVEDLQICHKAILNRGYGSKARSSHERLQYGDIVQVLLKNGFEHKQFLSGSLSDLGTPNFFVIGGLVRSISGVSSLIVKKCNLVSPSSLGQLPNHSQEPFVEVCTSDFYVPNTQQLVYFLALDSSIRKVGVLHNCAKYSSCKFLMGSRVVEHSTTTLGGGHFFVLTRSMAYPPRRS